MKITRRAFIRYGFEIGAMAGGVGILSMQSSQSLYLRPPRSLQEKKFTSHCMRCGVCLEVCPTKCLSLVDIALDFKNISTPVISPQHGGCLAWKTGCDACARACPTGAIEPLMRLSDSKPGYAQIAPEKCENCMVCLRRCPVEGTILFPNPDGAPFTREEKIPTRLKLIHSPLKPYINRKKCVGCALCAHYCPPQIITIHPEDSAL